MKLSKNENLFSHLTVGGDTNRGVPPWPVSKPVTLAIVRNPENHF